MILGAQFFVWHPNPYTLHPKAPQPAKNGPVYPSSYKACTLLGCLTSPHGPHSPGLLDLPP